MPICTPTPGGAHAEAHSAIETLHTDLLIGGDWVPATSGHRFDVINPATEETIATVADGGPIDAERAIETAAATQRSWAAVPPRERSEILRRAYDLTVTREREIALLGLNTGLVSNPAAPFGGVKESGLGREGGRVGIDEYLEIHYLAVPRDVRT